jgi:hypothetical protein
MGNYCSNCCSIRQDPFDTGICGICDCELVEYAPDKWITASPVLTAEEIANTMAKQKPPYEFCLAPKVKVIDWIKPEDPRYISEITPATPTLTLQARCRWCLDPTSIKTIEDIAVLLADLGLCIIGQENYDNKSELVKKHFKLQE